MVSLNVYSTKISMVVCKRLYVCVCLALWGCGRVWLGGWDVYLLMAVLFNVFGRVVKNSNKNTYAMLCYNWTGIERWDGLKNALSGTKELKIGTKREQKLGTLVPNSNVHHHLLFNEEGLKPVIAQRLHDEIICGRDLIRLSLGRLVWNKRRDEAGRKDRK